jgi:hypothetical protein
MKNLTLCISLLFSTIVLSSDYTPVIDLNNVDDLKAEILLIAQDNLGKPDQDFRIQNTLVPYVNKLLKLAPQKPIKERITALVGRWQQVWGPCRGRRLDVREGVLHLEYPRFEPANFSWARSKFAGKLGFFVS